MQVSRRSFLKGSATAAAAGVVGATLATTNVQQAQAYFATDGDLWAIGDIAEPSETIQADMVIVGGGGTGVCAAIEAKELGLDPVVVDYGDTWGGSFVGTEGMCGINTPYTDGTADVLALTTAAMDYHHWIANRGLILNFLNKTTETIPWLEEHGAKFGEVKKANDLGSYIHDYDHSEVTDGLMPGQIFIGHLGDTADALGVRSYFNTGGRKVLMEDGKVAGLLAEREDGSVLKIEAPAVLLAGGGYSTNEPLLRELCDVLMNDLIYSVGPQKRDGSCLKMAADCGAIMAPSPGCVQWCGPVIPGAGWQSDAFYAVLQPTLWINQDAKRFCDESMYVRDFAATGIVQARQKRSFFIMSDADLQNFETTGLHATNSSVKQAGDPCPGLREVFENLDGVYQVDTIEEAAQVLDLDEQALAKTLEEYNEYCENGVDAEFGKAAEFLNTLEGPFWVAQTQCGYYCTDGGIYVSPNLEALDANAQVIPGLYAGGCDVGGLFGDSYDFKIISCTGTGFAACSGRIAAEQINSYINA